MTKGNLDGQKIVQAVVEHLPEKHDVATVQGNNGPGFQIITDSKLLPRYSRSKSRLKGRSSRLSDIDVRSSASLLPTAQKDSSAKDEPYAEIEDGLRLRDVAQLSGFSEQYILNLVERYQIIAPQRIGSYGSRSTYHFSGKDLEKIKQVRDLTGKGKSLRDITNLMHHSSDYQQAATSLASALLDLLTETTFNEESWEGVVWSLTQIPSLTEQERTVLILIEGRNCSLADCAAKMGTQSDKEVKALLDSAYNKLGSAIFYTLRLSAQRQQ